VCGKQPHGLRAEAVAEVGSQPKADVRRRPLEMLPGVTVWRQERAVSTGTGRKWETSLNRNRQVQRSSSRERSHEERDDHSLTTSKRELLSFQLEKWEGRNKTLNQKRRQHGQSRARRYSV